MATEASLCGNSDFNWKTVARAQSALPSKQVKKFVVLYVGGILGLALLYPVVRWAGGEKKPLRIYPSLAAVIPADTQYAVGFQLERLKKTPLYKRLIETRRLPAIEEFVARTGFDPRKSIYEIVLVSNGQETIALAVGKFSRTTELRQGMEPPIKIEGDRVTRMTYKGYTLEGNEGAALCFLNSATAMAGPASALRAMIDRQQQNPQPPPELLRMIEAIPLENQIWGVATGEVNRLLSNLKLGGSGLQSLPFQLTGLTLEADASTGFQMKATLLCPEAKSAEQLAFALRGALALAPMPKEYSGTLEQLDIRQDDTKVILRLNLSADLLDQLLGV